MRRLRLAGLVLTGALVLTFVISMVAGLGGGNGAATAPLDERPGEQPAEPSAEERIRVEVLNAAGVPGLARVATQRLREAGIDVVYYGNARGFGGDTTLVLDRLGDEARARRVAAALGLGEVRVALDTTLYVDVSVVVGRDWAEREETAASPR